VRGTGSGQACARCQSAKAKCERGRVASQAVVVVPSRPAGERAPQEGGAETLERRIALLEQKEAAQEKRDAELLDIHKRRLALEEARIAEQAQREDRLLALEERSVAAMENLASAIRAHASDLGGLARSVVTSPPRRLTAGVGFPFGEETPGEDRARFGPVENDDEGEEDEEEESTKGPSSGAGPSETL
jgi:hypothetical protein